MAESNGLLDFLNSPGGMGLLSAVGAGLAGARRGGTWNAVGSGLLGGVQGYAQGQDLQRQNEYATQRGKLFDMQAQQLEQQQAAAKAEAERQAARQNYLGSVGQVTSPRLDAQPNKFDPMQFVRLGGSIDEAQKLAGMGDWGRAEVARTLESQDAQGNKVTLMFDKFGRPVGDGVQGYTAPVQVDLGGRVQFVKPQAGVNLTKTMTPSEIASNAVARGNLAVSQQRLALDKQGKPEFRDGQWIVPPRDMKPGESRPVTAPTAVKDANEAIALIGQARKLLPQATGSYGGWLVDQGMRVVGSATDGAKATAQLQAIEGALVAKMPKMSGPQSDKDVALYKQMAGVVGDPTIPVEQRQAALDTIEQIQQRYAGQTGGATGSFGATQPQGKTVVRTGTMNGRKVVQYSDGTTAYAD